MIETHQPEHPSGFSNDYEALMGNAQGEVEAPEVTPEGLETRLIRAEEQVTSLKEQYVASHGLENTGGSSFYDVTGNLLANAKSCLGYWKDMGELDPEDLESFAEDVGWLEQYLAVIDSDPKILEAEMTERDGAFPDVRRQADELKSEGVIPRPITYYIQHVSKQALR